jgi:hypothetical protein
MLSHEDRMAEPASYSKPAKLTPPIQVRAKGMRPRVRTVQEALRMIDNELPAELRSQSRWTFARALLVEAAKTGKKRDIGSATRQLKQALENEGWLEQPVPA